MTTNYVHALDSLGIFVKLFIQVDEVLCHHQSFADSESKESEKSST